MLRAMGRCATVRQVMPHEANVWWHTLPPPSWRRHRRRRLRRALVVLVVLMAIGLVEIAGAVVLLEMAAAAVR